MPTRPKAIKWAINADLYPALAGSVQLTITGPAGETVKVRRNTDTGWGWVRLATHDTGSGLLVSVDPEAAFGSNTYEVIVGGSVVARSNRVWVPGLPGNEAMLRVALRPNVAWQAVTVEDITDIQRDVVSARWTVIGKDYPVVTADTRQRMTGTMSLIVPSLPAADRLIETVLRDGLPILLRLCPGSRMLERDMYFLAQGLEESRLSFKSERRRIVFDWVEVPPPDGETDLPPPTLWTYDGRTGVGCRVYVRGGGRDVD